MKSRGKRVYLPDGTFIVASKAANGDGSIYAVADGGYKATYLDNGKRRTVRGRTKAAAAARRDEKLAVLARATPTGRLGINPTVADVATWWLDDMAAPSVRPSTLHAYRKDVTRFTDRIGSTPIVGLDVETVRSFMARLRRDGFKASTMTNTRTRLRQVAQAAVELGYLDKNPVVAVPAPTVTAKDRTRRKVLDAGQVQELLGVLDPARRYDAAVCLLFTSGIRVNEALGLAWSDLVLDPDTGTGTATLRRGCTYAGGGVGSTLDDLKTDATHGTHHLSPTTVAMLVARRHHQDLERAKAGGNLPVHVYEGEPLDLVFTNKKGGLAARQHVQSALVDALGRAGIDPTRIATHTGRRSTVTALYVAGVPIDDIARHVGHTRSSTTAGYVHDLGSRPVDTANRAAQLLDPAAQVDG